MAAPAKPQDPRPLLGHHQTMASKVLVETVGELAKQGLAGDDLEKRATELANSLRSGLAQLTSTTCSAQSASDEKQ